MPFDPQVKEYLEKATALNLPRYDQVTPVEARRMFIERRANAGKPEEVESIEEQTLDAGIKIRVYHPAPQSLDKLDAPCAGLVYFHGGGWVLGNLDTIDVPCRGIANASGRVVISVDYRLAPEHQYPLPLEDCFAATKHVMTRAGEFGVDPKRLAVGGDRPAEISRSASACSPAIANGCRTLWIFNC